jgi:two-component sensor histidine kinase
MAAAELQTPAHHRVMVIAPYGRDAEVLGRVLASNTCDPFTVGLKTDDVHAAAKNSPDVILLTAEAVKPQVVDILVGCLGDEPVWSLPPIVLLADDWKGAERSVTRLRAAKPALRITSLIRPCRGADIASAVASAAAARRHQHQIHALMERQRTAKERANFLFDELSHRVKNMFSMVSAIGTMTEQSTDDSEGFRNVFSRRMAALSKSYDALREGDWEEASLAQIAREAVGVILVAEERDRLELVGPDIAVGSRVAASLGLVLHELASNARKYGAFSVDDGVVQVAWSEGADGQVDLRWTEKGGPPAVAPQHEGFGTTVIRSGISGAKVDLDYDPEGLKCCIRFSRSR